MSDRRRALLGAAIDVIREGGYPALTQSRVAAAAGMTQGHLTYYFPTRSDLVRAVAEAVVHAQLSAFDARTLPASRDEAVRTVTALVTARDNVRVFRALLLAAACRRRAR